MKINWKSTTTFTYLAMLALMLLFNTNKTVGLNLYKQNDHFQLFCSETDQTVSAQILNQLEDRFQQFTKDFNHVYSKIISILIYPDLNAFHEAIKMPSAPDWLVAESNIDIIKAVSPANPGPYHSCESMITIYSVCLVHLFLLDKEDYNNAPYWLLQGVALYKGGKSYAVKDQLPTIAELDAIQDNALNFDEINGFAASYIFVQFIDRQWGWDTVLKLLENYSKFEEILGLSKEEFRNLSC